MPWRIGLPFAAVVLIGSVVLVLLIQRDVAEQGRRQFRELAEINAGFLRGRTLPFSDGMARNLGQILGVQVTFRGPSGLVSDTEVTEELAEVRADGFVQQVAGLEVVGVPLDDRTDLLLSRPAGSTEGTMWRAPTVAVLLAFWALAGVVGWIVGRGLVQPLRTLSARLPEIERDEPLQLAESTRPDEIGDVARALVRTQTALHEQRRLNERSEKLAVLGRMTAALAHEIQNPVAAIKLHAQLHPDETSSLIESEAGRIEDLLNQWLFLSRPEPPTTGCVDLGQLAEDCLLAHRARLDHARVTASIDGTPGTESSGDRKRLTQVFNNLIVNAIQAMPRGGHLTVTVRSGQENSVSFEDEGAGFSPEALARASEFFFSEKEGGMGIGLSVVAGIVSAHQGRLAISNREGGRGARVAVHLPAIRAEES